MSFLLLLISLSCRSASAQDNSSVYFINPRLDFDVLSTGSGESGGPKEADTYITVSFGYRWFTESLKYRVPWGFQGALGFGIDGDLDSAVNLSLRFPVGMRQSGSFRLFTFNLGPGLQYYQSSAGTLVLGAGGFLELVLNTDRSRSYGFFASLSFNMTPSWGISGSGSGFLLHTGLSIQVGLAVNHRKKN